MTKKRRLIDLIRDLCLKVSEKDKFFYAKRAPDNMTKERRFICHDFIEMSDALKSAQLLRSLVCRGFKLPVVFKLLRVLTMASDCSAEDIMQNLNLRCLTFLPFGLSILVRLPSSISFIWNLQTLTIDAKLVVAPIEIWSLSQLRHVECTRIYLPHPPPSPNECVVMGNLQTLTKAVNLRLSEEVCKRIPNTNKLHLIYDKKLEGYEECLFDHLHNLGSLHKLQSLRLVPPFASSSCNADRLKYAFPVSLKKLSLRNCSHYWNDLTIIGSLPQLEALELGFVKGQKWSPVNGEFLRLKFLSIDSCDLRCWDADSSHFPVLKMLSLEGLKHLEEIPLDIGEIPTLEIISVVGCSESAEISAMKIKEEQESLGNEGLQVRIVLAMNTLRSLSKRIRIDFLTLTAGLRFPNGRTFTGERSLNELTFTGELSLDYLYD